MFWWTKTPPKQGKGGSLSSSSSALLSSTSSGLLLLLILLPLVVVGRGGSKSRKSGNAPIVSDVLITLTFDVWYLSCYLEHPQDSDAANIEEGQQQLEKEKCCSTMITAYKELIHRHLADAALIPRNKRALSEICESQIAPVPQKFLDDDDSAENKNNTVNFWLADYTLVVMTDHHLPSHNDKITVRQFYYDALTRQMMIPEISVADGELSPSPLILPQRVMTRKPSIPGKIIQMSTSPDIGTKSIMSNDGGMHRIVDHTLSTTSVGTTTTKSYMVWMIPHGLFVDLEQFFVNPEAGKVHFSRICDIEQPAFDSPQHVVIIELSNGSNNNNNNPNDTLQTRVHLRYPLPGTKRIQWVEPHLFEISIPHKTNYAGTGERTISMMQIEGSQPSTTYFKVHDWKDVASGKDEDYMMVQTITVAACLIGVAIMLWDISYVSKWD